VFLVAFIFLVRLIMGKRGLQDDDEESGAQAEPPVTA